MGYNYPIFTSLLEGGRKVGGARKEAAGQGRRDVSMGLQLFLRMCSKQVMNRNYGHNSLLSFACLNIVHFQAVQSGGNREAHSLREMHIKVRVLSSPQRRGRASGRHRGRCKKSALMRLSSPGL